MPCEGKPLKSLILESVLGEYELLEARGLREYLDTLSQNNFCFLLFVLILPLESDGGKNVIFNAYYVGIIE